MYVGRFTMGGKARDTRRLTLAYQLPYKLAFSPLPFPLSILVEIAVRLGDLVHLVY